MEKIKKVISKSYIESDNIYGVLYPGNIKITEEKKKFIDVGVNFKIEKGYYDETKDEDIQMFKIIPQDIPIAEVRELAKKILEIKDSKKVTSLKELKKEISNFGEDITVLMNTELYLERFGVGKKGFEMISFHEGEIRMLGIPVMLIYRPDRKDDIFLIKKDSTTIEYSKSDNKYSEKLFVDVWKDGEELRLKSYVKMKVGKINPEKVKVLNVKNLK